MDIDFPLARQVMQSQYGVSASPGAPPMPMIAFDLLHAVDTLFAALSVLDPDIQRVRFRFDNSLGHDLLEMEVKRQGADKWIARPALEDHIRDEIDKTLIHLNVLIAPLPRPERRIIASLVFTEARDSSLESWYSCSPKDISSRVEIMLKPHGCRMLKALELARELEGGTSSAPAPAKTQPRF